MNWPAMSGLLMRIVDATRSINSFQEGSVVGCKYIAERVVLANAHTLYKSDRKSAEGQGQA